LRRRTTPTQRSNLVLLKSATSRQVAGKSQPASWMKTMMRIARAGGIARPDGAHHRFQIRRSSARHTREGVPLGDPAAVALTPFALTPLLEQAATRRDRVPLSCMPTTRRSGVGLWSRQDQDRRPAPMCAMNGLDLPATCLLVADRGSLTLRRGGTSASPCPMSRWTTGTA
jgi:hypothetical protein